MYVKCIAYYLVHIKYSINIICCSCYCSYSQTCSGYRTVVRSPKEDISRLTSKALLLGHFSFPILQWCHSYATFTFLHLDCLSKLDIKQPTLILLCFKNLLGPYKQSLLSNTFSFTRFLKKLCWVPVFFLSPFPLNSFWTLDAESWINSTL